MSLPVAVLIEEHKLILRAVDTIKKQIGQMQSSKSANPPDVALMVDFLRTYADRFHHGKEEGILFRQLTQKKMSESDRKMMNELVLEHATARRTVTALESANKSYISGDAVALNDILKMLEALVNLYPAHINKEDTRFFYPSMAYFTVQEQQKMLASFREFNTNFTDKRYSQIISSIG